jgi:lipopolysaccharide export system permease protein
MSIIDKHIGYTVLWSVLGVLVLIVGLDAVFALIGELDYLKNDYQLLEAAIYIALAVPGKIHEYIPVGTLIGCLVGLGTLANSNELTVIRAAGVSVFRIIGAAVKPLLLIIAIGFALGQYVVPETEQYAESRKSMLVDGSDVLSARSGFWYREGDTFLNMRAVQPNGVIYGVARYRFDSDDRLVEVDVAERGIFQGDHWLLQNVRQTSLAADSSRQNVVESLRWDTAFTPHMLSVVTLSAEHLSVTDLFHYARFRRDQNLESGPYFFAFWQKTLQPVTTVVMVFIAASFIFGPLRSVTMGQRLITGIIVGLLFNYGQQTLGHISVVYSMPPLLAAALPIALCLLLGIRLLRKV